MVDTSPSLLCRNYHSLGFRILSIGCEQRLSPAGPNAAVFTKVTRTWTTDFTAGKIWPCGAIINLIFGNAMEVLKLLLGSNQTEMCQKKEKRNVQIYNAEVFQLNMQYYL